MLLVKQAAVRPAPDGAADESRPALAARRMLRILSTESARQMLRPFYRGILQEFLAQEWEEYRSKPARSLLLVQSMLGRHQTLTTLRRFYRKTTRELDGSLLRTLIRRSCVRHIRRDEGENPVYRYVRHELTVSEDLRGLPAAKRPAPPRPQSEREAEHGSRAEPQKPAPAGGPLLSDTDFQALVRGVTDALSRQSRVGSLRRGGM